MRTLPFRAPVVAVVLIAASALCVPPAALAESAYLEQLVSQSGVMGQPPSSATQKLWITDDKLRMEDGASGMITVLRLDQKKALIIDPQEKSYADIPLEQLSQMAQMGLAMLQQMGKGEMKLDVRKTEETAKIGEWNAYAVVMELSGPASSRIKLWLCKDLKLDLRSWIEMSKYFGGAFGADALEKMRAFEGWPVKQESTTDVMGMKITSTTELKLFRPGPVDAALFEPPAGYTRTEGLEGMMGGTERKE